MRVAVSMWSVVQAVRAGEMDTVGFVAFAAACGAAGVELLDIFWRDREAELPAVREALARHGLAVAAYDTGNDFCQPDPSARAAQVDRVRQAVDVAVALGAPVVRVFAGDLRPGYTYGDCVEWLVAGLRQVADYAAERGVTLALENHGRLAGRSDQVLDLLQRVGSPALRAAVDTANFLLVGEDPVRAVAALAPWAAHVHAKDFAPAPPGWEGHAYAALDGTRYRGVVAGEGAVGLPRALAHLWDAGYRGWVSVEYEGDDPRAGTAASVAAVARLCAALAGGQGG